MFFADEDLERFRRASDKDDEDGGFTDYVPPEFANYGRSNNPLADHPGFRGLIAIDGREVTYLEGDDEYVTAI